MLLPITTCITDADRATLTYEQIEAKFAAQPIAHVNGRDYTKSDLDKAFDLVRHPENWKRTIDCRVQLTDEQVCLIQDAVIYFTGSVPTFTPVSHSTVQFNNAGVPERLYHVKADGYYLTCGS